MTVGERIRDRLRELNQSVSWLASKTKIPPSTLYDLIRGDIESTPRLPTIAATLGVCALWLEKKSGPMTPDEADAESILEATANSWPFTIDRARFDRLQDAQKQQIQGAVLNLILEFEGRNTRRKSRKVG